MFARHSWQRRTMCAGLMALLAIQVSCGESTSGSSGAGGIDPTMEPYMEDHVHEQDSVLIEGNAAIQAALATGELELRGEKPFMGALIQLTSYQRYELEYSYEKTDGSRAAWATLPLDRPEDPQNSASLILNEEANAIFLRTVEENTPIEYLNVLFFEEIPSIGILDVHYEWAEEQVDIATDQTTTTNQLLTRQQGVSRSGRYVPPASVVAAGREQRVSYNDGPAWNPRNCGGTFLPGTRALAEHLVATFPGARSYQGYSCRPNTARPSRMSIHGTGRAIDLFVPRHSGDADNDLGDPIANWLIENAEVLGVQYFIWDRTSWGASRSGDKHRRYTGPNPHTDHLHIELSIAGAAQRTPWHQNQGTATNPSTGGGGSPSAPIPSENVTCRSATLGSRVQTGTCVQMSYEAFGGRCNWAQCGTAGNWVQQTDPDNCPGTAHVNVSCQGINSPSNPTPTEPPPGARCYSRTLGSQVDSNSCVQVDYESNSCAKCGWFKCIDGAWSCTELGSCTGDSRPHANCAEPGEQPNELRIRLEWSEQTDLDLFVREPSGDIISFDTNQASTNDGLLHNNNSCRGNTCGNIPKPYYEDAIWGELSSEITPGTYTYWVQNYSGKAASNFTVRITRTNEDGELVLDETQNLSVPAERRFKGEEHTVEIN